MAATNNIFGVLVAEYSPTLPHKAIHVCVSRWIRPASLADKPGVICLTADAVDPDEFAGHIDELIEQLEALKTKGRRKLAAIAAEQAKDGQGR